MMLPYYSIEMVLVGIILFIGMSIAGIQLWIKKKNKSKQESLVNTDQNIENHKDL